MSESSLNISSIRTYADQVGQKLTDDFFKTKKTITGQEILRFCPVKQVNYFVLKNLFTKWQSETTRLESPYFNYKNEEVRKSMQALMNVLSQNILLNEEACKPLATEAVSETLLLLLSPYDYYHKNIETTPYLTLRYLRSQAKYIRINKHLYTQLLEDLENENVDGNLDKKLVIERLEGIFKNTKDAPEDVDPYISEFAKIHPLNVNDFFNGNFSLSASEEAEIDEIQNKLFQDFEEMDELAIEKSRQQLNDRFTKQQKTLNDRLATDSVNIATAHAAKKVSSIQKSISINQRYMFVKELFEGESDAFDEAIKEVESCETFEAAVGLLVQNYAKNYRWNMQSSEIKDLLRVIIKKFK